MEARLPGDSPCVSFSPSSFCFSGAVELQTGRGQLAHRAQWQIFGSVSCNCDAGQEKDRLQCTVCLPPFSDCSLTNVLTTTFVVVVVVIVVGTIIQPHAPEVVRVGVRDLNYRLSRPTQC